MDELNDIFYNCRRHGKVNKENISKAGTRNGIQEYRCKLCKKIARDNNYKKNPEKVKERIKKNKNNNPEKFKLMRKISSQKYLIKHKEKIKNYQKERERREIENLDDNYIKHSLTKGNSLSYKDIPQNLIEFKRLLMQLKRKTKLLASKNKLGK